MSDVRGAFFSWVRRHIDQGGGQGGTPLCSDVDSQGGPASDTSQASSEGLANPSLARSLSGKSGEGLCACGCKLVDGDGEVLMCNPANHLLDASALARLEQSGCAMIVHRTFCTVAATISYWLVPQRKWLVFKGSELLNSDDAGVTQQLALQYVEAFETNASLPHCNAVGPKVHRKVGGTRVNRPTLPMDRSGKELYARAYASDGTGTTFYQRRNTKRVLNCAVRARMWDEAAGVMYHVDDGAGKFAWLSLQDVLDLCQPQSEYASVCLAVQNFDRGRCQRRMLCASAAKALPAAQGAGALPAGAPPADAPPQQPPKRMSAKRRQQLLSAPQVEFTEAEGGSLRNLGGIKQTPTYTQATSWPELFVISRCGECSALAMDQSDTRLSSPFQHLERLLLPSPPSCTACESDAGAPSESGSLQNSRTLAGCLPTTFAAMPLILYWDPSDNTVKSCPYKMFFDVFNLPDARWIQRCLGQTYFVGPLRRTGPILDCILQRACFLMQDVSKFLENLFHKVLPRCMPKRARVYEIDFYERSKEELAAIRQEAPNPLCCGCQQVYTPREMRNQRLDPSQPYCANVECIHFAMQFRRPQDGKVRGNPYVRIYVLWALVMYHLQYARTWKEGRWKVKRPSPETYLREQNLRRGQRRPRRNGKPPKLPAFSKLQPLREAFWKNDDLLVCAFTYILPTGVAPPTPGVLRTFSHRERPESYRSVQYSGASP